MFKIEDDFKNCLPELSRDEYTELEKDIVKNGVLSPIVIWDGTIVDGHNRYAICRAHHITNIPTKEMNFSSKDEALAWIYQNQLGRRNLTDNDRRYLLGKLYEQRKKLHGGIRKSFDKDSSVHFDHMKEQCRTSEIIAKEQGTSSPTVRRSEKYSKGIDIGESISPGFKNDVLSGKVDADLSTIQSIPKLTKEEQEETVKEIHSGTYRQKKGGKGNSVSAIAKEITQGLEKPKIELRRCKKCGKELPVTEFYTHHRNTCKRCFNGRKTIKDVKGNTLHILPELRNVTEEEIIGNLYDTEREIEYTDDDLKAEIDAKIEDFKWSVQNCLKIHSDILKDERSREKVLSNLSLLQTEITKWKEQYRYERI